ncbi:MAG TPA: F0F1 ATP synthase subunit B [Candidatus Binatia bacterium]|nr:F0F1 ATP synthase subunit B [Candidatus Binatia bacterium]
MCQRERDWVRTVARIVVLLVLLAPAVAGAASEGGHEGGGLISLDKSLIVQAINFLILLFILQRLLYRPFLAKMEERTQAIQKSLDEAQAAREAAARQQAENEVRLRAAYAEAAAIRTQALKDAADEQRRLVDAARAESQRLVEAAKAQMDADVRRARDELRREVADLATSIAEKLVRRSLRDEDHRRIVADAIGKVGN